MEFGVGGTRALCGTDINLIKDNAETTNQDKAHTIHNYADTVSCARNKAQTTNKDVSRAWLSAFVCPLYMLDAPYPYWLLVLKCLVKIAICSTNR
jgi:hypothetical protein